MESNITPERKEQLKNYRDRGFGKLKKFALVQVLAALAFFAVGVVDTVYVAKNPQFPYIIVAPLVVSVLVLIGGICGYLAGSNGLNKEEISAKVRSYFVAHYILSVICIIFCVLTVGVGVWGLLLCLSTSVEDKAQCLPEVTAMTAISGAVIGLGTVLLMISIMGTCFLCFYGSALGIKSKREQSLEWKIEMQRYLDAQRTGNAVQYQGQGQTQPQGQQTQPEGQQTQPEGQLNQGYYTWT